MCVLVSHGLYFTNRVHGIGRVGVNLFFFISGVLVYRSLSKPKKTGLALAADFWKRRLRRLYPALATYILAMLPVVFLLQHQPGGRLSDPWDYLWRAPLALAYVTNFVPDNPMALGHLWSVSCEMQFYLLSPLIFLLGGQSARRRQLVWVGLLAVLMIVGFVEPLFDRAGNLKYQFEVAVWPMMLGFCCEYRKDLFQRVPKRWSPFIMGGTLLAFVTIAVLMLFGMEMKLPVIALGTFVFLPCFLNYSWGRPLGGQAGRVFTWLGERTYSIYLWQQAFTICGYLPDLWHPVGAVLSNALGGVWFRLFEQPFLSSSRKRFVQKQSDG